MNKVCGAVLVAAIIIIHTCGTVEGADDSEVVADLTWNDLVPKEFNLSWILKKHNVTIRDVLRMKGSSHKDKKILEEIQTAYKKASVVHKLNGKRIRISGFVAPLQSSRTITEFLLVPYFGACIHVPPPPANQIIYVRSDKGIPMERLFSTVQVTGTLKTENISSGLAESGYSMKVDGIN